VTLPKGTTELERVTDVVGLPWVGDREACAVAFQGRVACFDLGNGGQIWGRDMSSSSGLGVDARYVYVSEDRGAVSALDRTSGRSLWRQDKLANRSLSAPLPLGAEIAVGDIEGYVHFLGRDNGAFVGRFETDGSPVRAAPIPLGGAGFLVQTSNGTLYALATK
jgi:outer membrane protein assembly factor BamB